MPNALVILVSIVYFWFLIYTYQIFAITMLYYAVFYQKNNWIAHMKRHGVIVNWAAGHAIPESITSRIKKSFRRLGQV